MHQYTETRAEILLVKDYADKQLQTDMYHNFC